MGESQVEVAGPAAVFDQHHQQPVTALHQPDRLQPRLWLFRSGDQTHQPGEVRQPTGQLLQQIIQGGPAEAEARELPLEMLHGNARLRQQIIDVMAVAQGTGDASR